MNDKKDDDFEESNIRPPDSVKTERLIDDFMEEDKNLLQDINLLEHNLIQDTNIYDITFEKEVEQAFEESKKEFEERIARENEYENRIMQDYLTMVEKNKTKFQPLINDLNRLSKFDIDTREIYDILEPIIDSYCANILPFVEFDKVTYNRIFTPLKI